MHDANPLPIETPHPIAYNSQSPDSFSSYLQSFLSRGFDGERPTLLARAAVHTMLLRLQAEALGQKKSSELSFIGNKIVHRFKSFEKEHPHHQELFYTDMGRELADLIQSAPTNPTAAKFLPLIQAQFAALGFPKDDFQKVERAALQFTPNETYDIPVLKFLADLPVPAPAVAVAPAPEPKPTFQATRSVPTVAPTAKPVLPFKGNFPVKR